MDFTHSERSLELQRRVADLIDRWVLPRNAQWHRAVEAGEYPPAFMAELKEYAKSEDLWNFFLPGLGRDEPGIGLSHVEYAPIAELTGRNAGRLFWPEAPPAHPSRPPAEGAGAAPGRTDPQGPAGIS